MTDLGEQERRWDDVPLQEPTPGQPVPEIDDEPLPLDPVKDPVEVEAQGAWNVITSVDLGGLEKDVWYSIVSGPSGKQIARLG